MTSPCYHSKPSVRFTLACENENKILHIAKYRISNGTSTSHEERRATLFSHDKGNKGQQIEEIIGTLASCLLLECWKEPRCFKALTLQPLWLNTLP